MSDKFIQSARFDRLTVKIRAYDSGFNMAELKKAMAWADKRYKSTNKPVKHDEFSDAMLIAERLVDFAKADRETLLASILYPSVRPIGGNSVDVNGLNEIEQHFGRGTRKLVERTLQFRSLQYLPLETGDAETREKHIRDFQLMGLWVALDPRAILIRGTQLAVNLDFVADKIANSITVPLEVRREMVFRARNSLAPMAAIAGYGKLREVLLDLALRVYDPQMYAEVSKWIDKPALQAQNGEQKTMLLKHKQMATAAEAIAHFIEKNCALDPKNFRVEIRKKRPHSALAKAERKHQAVNELGDLYAFRVVINKYQGGERDLDAEELQKQCHTVYRQFSRFFGRGNKQELGAEFKLPENVNAFDDYYKDTKPSGYKALHDAFFIPIGGARIRFEGQIVDEESYDNNMNGPSANHNNYKLGMSEDSPAIRAWRPAAIAALRNEKYDQGYTFVYGHNYEIVGGEGKFPVADFVRKQYGDKTAIEFIGINIESNDPINTRNPTTNYAPSEVLESGDRVLRPQFRPEYTGDYEI